MAELQVIEGIEATSSDLASLAAVPVFQVPQALRAALTDGEADDTSRIRDFELLAGVER